MRALSLFACGHPLCDPDGRDPPGLRADNVAVGRVPPALLGALQPLVQDVLRHLRALAAARHAGDDHHLAPLQRLQDPEV